MEPKVTERGVNVLFVVVASVLAATYLSAHLAEPPPGMSGAPGEGRCWGSGCHNSYGVNSGPGELSIRVADRLPADTVLLEVALASTGASRFGFEASVLVFGGDTAREIVPVDSDRTQILMPPDSGHYISHTAAGAEPLSPDTTAIWQFKVIAPPADFADAGCPAVFVSAVAANGDALPTGDYVYTAESLLVVGQCFACPVPVTGDLNQTYTVTSADIIELVGYVFKGGTEPQPCAAAADVNCDVVITAADIIFLVNHVFKGGPFPCDACRFSALIWDC